MSEPAATLLSVRGEARVSVEPDSVTLNGLLTASRDTKPDALRHAATRLNQLTADLGSLGGTPLSVGSADQPLTWSAYASTTEVEHEHDKQTGNYGPTGRVIASVAVSIVVRSFDILDQVAGVLANHDALRVHTVTWDVDANNPSWPQVRAAAIRAAITKGRDYAAALGGSLHRVEHIADVGLLAGEPSPHYHLTAAAAVGLAGGMPETPSLDPVPQELIAVIDARFSAFLAAL
jgi:uncharacterized protein YggE